MQPVPYTEYVCWNRMRVFIDQLGCRWLLRTFLRWSRERRSGGVFFKRVSGNGLQKIGSGVVAFRVPCGKMLQWACRCPTSPFVATITRESCGSECDGVVCYLFCRYVFLVAGACCWSRKSNRMGVPIELTARQVEDATV